ncbi:MAG: zf-HC2 domain-containing protein [Verrucomicrobia bacterium]|nr:zf-HC2 domain-containing protein [Verrucomicrobiota bacterium]
MMTINQTEREEIEALLPWHAAGTLSRRDAQRVEAALEEDRDLARQFELVRDELSETIHLNETLGAPSARAMEKLFAGIEAEPKRRQRRSFDLAAFIGERLTVFSPRTLAWSATAAVLAIVLQAGLLAGLYLGEPGSEQPAAFRTASAPTRSFAPAGSYALIGFTAQASAADVTKFLETHKAAIVDGPKPGGLYRIRVAQAALPKADLAAIVKQMQDESKIVRFVAATE